MKKIFSGICLLLCAYGILAYTLGNPNGAKKLKKDIDLAAIATADKAVEVAESARVYVDKTIDENN